MSEQALGFRAADSEPRAGLERWHVEEARTAASERWREPHILVDARASSLGQIVSSVRAASARHGICAAVVDYLQLVRAPRTVRENREQVVAHISRELCLAGKEVGVAMIVAAQLNREADKRQNKRPMLAELRESGAIEQDADSVLGLYREGAYDAKSLRKDVCEVHVLKQRHGPIGRRDLYYRPGSGFGFLRRPGERAVNGIALLRWAIPDARPLSERWPEWAARQDAVVLRLLAAVRSEAARTALRRLRTRQRARPPG